jgi:hypothetical protein
MIRASDVLDALRAEPIYPSMKKVAVAAAALATLTGGGLVGEAVISAGSAESHCTAPTSCTERPPVEPPWSPDNPEPHNGADLRPITQIEAINAILAGFMLSRVRRPPFIRRRRFVRNRPRLLYPIH